MATGDDGFGLVGIVLGLLGVVTCHGGLGLGLTSVAEVLLFGGSGSGGFLHWSRVLKRILTKSKLVVWLFLAK